MNDSVEPLHPVHRESTRSLTHGSFRRAQNTSQRQSRVSWNLGVLDTSLRAPVTEPPIRTQVHQRGGGVSTRNPDAESHTPPRVDSRRGIDGAFSHDRRIRVGWSGYRVRLVVICASHTEDSRRYQRHSAKSVHQVTISVGRRSRCSLRALPTRDRRSPHCRSRLRSFRRGFRVRGAASLTPLAHRAGAGHDTHHEASVRSPSIRSQCGTSRCPTRLAMAVRW